MKRFTTILAITLLLSLPLLNACATHQDKNWGYIEVPGNSQTYNSNLPIPTTTNYRQIPTTNSPVMSDPTNPYLETVNTQPQVLRYENNSSGWNAMEIVPWLFLGLQAADMILHYDLMQRR